MSTTPETLVKYCSIETACAILEHRTLRWSSPVCFGDPLELTYNSRFQFEKSEMLPAAIKLASGMIFSRDAPQGDTPLINAIRRWRDDDRFQSAEEAEVVLKELLEKMIDARFGYMDKLLSVWKNYNKKLRVCCFYESQANLLAWQHYADKHRGVALCFNTGEYSGLKKATPVIYTEDRPELTSLQEQLNAIILNEKDRTAERFTQNHLLKARQFKLDQEWRCSRESPATEISSEPNNWHDDIKFERSDLTGLCFGLATSEKDKSKIQDRISAEYSAIKLQQAVLNEGKFSLAFNKV